MAKETNFTAGFGTESTRLPSFAKVSAVQTRMTNELNRLKRQITDAEERANSAETKAVSNGPNAAIIQIDADSRRLRETLLQALPKGPARAMEHVLEVVDINKRSGRYTFRLFLNKLKDRIDLGKLTVSKEAKDAIEALIQKDNKRKEAKGSFFTSSNAKKAEHTMLVKESKKTSKMLQPRVAELESQLPVIDLLADMAKAREKFREEAAALSKEVTDLQFRALEMERNQDRFQRSLELTGTLLKLYSERGAVQRSLNLLSSELKSLKVKIKCGNRKLREAKANLDRVSKDLASLADRHGDALAQNRELNGKQKKLNWEKNGHSNDFSELRVRIPEMAASALDMTLKRSKAKERLGQLGREIDLLECEFRDVTPHVTNVNSDIVSSLARVYKEKLAVSAESCRARSEALRTDLKKTNASIAAVEADMARLVAKCGFNFSIAQA